MEHLAYAWLAESRLGCRLALHSYKDNAIWRAKRGIRGAANLPVDMPGRLFQNEPESGVLYTIRLRLVGADDPAHLVWDGCHLKKLNCWPWGSMLVVSLCSNHRQRMGLPSSIPAEWRLVIDNPKAEYLADLIDD